MGRIHLPRNAVWFYDSESPVISNFCLWLDFPNSSLLCNGLCVMICVRKIQEIAKGPFPLFQPFHITEGIFAFIWICTIPRQLPKWPSFAQFFKNCYYQYVGNSSILIKYILIILAWCMSARVKSDREYYERQSITVVNNSDGKVPSRGNQ